MDCAGDDDDTESPGPGDDDDDTESLPELVQSSDTDGEEEDDERSTRQIIMTIENALSSCLKPKLDAIEKVRSGLTVEKIKFPGVGVIGYQSSKNPLQSTRVPSSPQDCALLRLQALFATPQAKNCAVAPPPWNDNEATPTYGDTGSIALNSPFCGFASICMGSVYTFWCPPRSAPVALPS